MKKKYAKKDRIEFEKFLAYRKKNAYCSCGHSIELKSNEEYTYCTWCGRKFIPERLRFRKIIKEKMKEDNYEGN